MHNRSFGPAWLALTGALALHVADEAANDFLSWYNPAVAAIRARLHWLPLPVFEFNQWLAGLIVAILFLLALSPLAFQGNRRLRIAAIPLGVLMTLNGLAHLTISALRGVVMPGALSSPALIAASVWLLRRATRAA